MRKVLCLKCKTIREEDRQIKIEDSICLECGTKVIEEDKLENNIKCYTKK